MIVRDRMAPRAAAISGSEPFRGGSKTATSSPFSSRLRHPFSAPALEDLEMCKVVRAMFVFKKRMFAGSDSTPWTSFTAPAKAIPNVPRPQ